MCTGMEIAALGMTASSLMNPTKQPKPPPAVQQSPVKKVKRDANGYGSTLLTGPQGLAAGSQNIGSSTLLGQ